MSDNKRHITLEPHSVGALLEEVVRASMHGAIPSSLLKHIAEGIAMYRTQVPEGSEGSTFALDLENELRAAYRMWKAKEDEFYGM